MKPLDFLNTPRCIIRRFHINDKEDLISLLGDRSVTKHMVFPQEILTEEGISNLLATTIKSYSSNNPMFAYAITQKDDDCLIGVTGFKPLKNKTIEIFYALKPAYWGRGFATEVLIKLSNYVFENENYDMITAPIAKANKVSIRVAEKGGFTNHGLQDHPDYDDLIYMLIKQKKYR